MVSPSRSSGLNGKLTSLRRTRLNEQVVAQIKNLIFSHELTVGEKLPSERELAANMAVSRVVVREALRSLEQSGLIEIRPGLAGGAFVVYDLQKPLFGFVYDLFRAGSLSIPHFAEARRVVESFTVRRAAETATAESIGRLRTINEEMARAVEDDQRFVALHSEFHKEIAHFSDNPLLNLFVEALFELLSRLRPNPSFYDRKFIMETYERHRAIIEALSQKDVALCEALMIADVEHTKRLRNAVSEKGELVGAGSNSQDGFQK